MNELGAALCALETVLLAFSGVASSGLVFDRCIERLEGATEAAGAYSIALSSAALEGALDGATDAAGTYSMAFELGALEGAFEGATEAAGTYSDLGALDGATDCAGAYSNCLDTLITLGGFV